MGKYLPVSSNWNTAGCILIIHHCLTSIFFKFNFVAHPSDPGGQGSDGRVESKSRYDWKDITEEFMSSASALQMGELLHDTKLAMILIIPFYIT